MSLPNSHTTADYIEWNTMLGLIKQLYSDGNYRMSLLVGCGCFFGLRISDLRKLTWEQLLSSDRFVLYEQKTGKRRVVKINEGFQKHILNCYRAMGKPEMNSPCFRTRLDTVVSIQLINRQLKEIKQKYGLQIENISSHSFRKTFGRRVVDQAGEQSEMALIKLSEIFNHSSPMITRRYLGLRAEELEKVYDGLSF